MNVCLYSPTGGFYSTRADGIGAHFGTSSASHPAFGGLIARQLEQMWRLLGSPAVFHVIEVGSGDGLLARSIVSSIGQKSPQLARALQYVAVDYQAGAFHSPGKALNRGSGTEDGVPLIREGADWEIQRVKSEGLTAFHNIVGCILSNELIDNLPVHRFAIQGGRVKEVYVTLSGQAFTEVLDEPSTSLIEGRLTELGLSLPEGYRGEVCLALEDWTGQISAALDRGFVLTIDYGELAADLYSPGNARGTLVCYRQHLVGDDPYRHIGQQDITCQVDFTSLMRLGGGHGLSPVGYCIQRAFLNNLGFSAYLEDLRRQGLSAARAEFNRTALMTLVDPDEYGNFKVLAQAKNVERGVKLLGFDRQGG